MPGERTFAAINGAYLYYEATGFGPPLVLIHGFSVDSHMWDDQMEAFSSYYRVIRYDLRGFGQSPPTTAPYAHIDDLRALLGHLGIAHAAILGLSMGGGIAIDFALAYPEATRALIAVDANLGGYRWTPEFDASLGSVYETGRSAGVDSARAQWLAHPLFAPAQEKPRVAACLAQMITAYSGWHWVNDDPGRWLKPPAFERLEAVAAPTLVVVGEREVPDFRALADALVARIPRARQVVLPGVGHMANMEDPDGFNSAVLAFLATLN
jgi:3-oxoadipate enol-lactonase